MRLIISPHIDDAFLSLGGSVLEWRKQGEQVHIIDVFSRSAATKRGLGSPTAVTRLRKREEAQARKLADSTVSYLNLPEAPLRGYPMQTGKFKYPKGSLNARDRRWVGEVEKKLRTKVPAQATLYVPLAIGEHVDHLLVRKVGERLMRRKRYRITFYEDLPYAGEFPLPRVFIRRYHLTPEIQPIEVTRKLRVLKVFKSQLRRGWLAAVREHAASLAKKQYAERMWVKS